MMKSNTGSTTANNTDEILLTRHRSITIKELAGSLTVTLRCRRGRVGTVERGGVGASGMHDLFLRLITYIYQLKFNRSIFALLSKDGRYGQTKK